MRRGFSLIETILAAFIFSLITMAVFNIFPSSVMAVKRGEMELEADSIAQRILEEHRAKPFDELVLTGPAPLAAETLAGTKFEPFLEIDSVPGSLEESLKAVRVEVRWSHSAKNYSLLREAWIVSVEN